MYSLRHLTSVSSPPGLGCSMHQGSMPWNRRLPQCTLMSQTRVYSFLGLMCTLCTACCVAHLPCMPAIASDISCAQQLSYAHASCLI